MLRTTLILVFFTSFLLSNSAVAEVNDEQFFTLSSGLNLRTFGGTEVRDLLSRRKGVGSNFGQKQKQQYCRLKENAEIQWSLADLETGKNISSSSNAGAAFFGASASKIFVAAALLNKQDGEISKKQLVLMSRMIVRSDNNSWKELQRQAGTGDDDNSGRQAVQSFIEKMGYENLRAFQGWMTSSDGSRLHGNELNSQAVTAFLYDTYHKNYPGAEILWKIMHATRTGSKKIDKYTPQSVFIAGKTGTYHGPNESKETIDHDEIKARNHVVIVTIDEKKYSLSILCNTGRDEDVAVLGGGLMREYLGVGDPIDCVDGK